MTEPKPAEEKKKQVRVEREIELAAPIEEVWKALTEGEELARWLPLEARVTPGAGGKIFLSWGPEMEGESEIVTWEPPRRLAGTSPFAFVEWTLESRRGKTVLRMVQSAFASGADWENEWFDSTSFGWDFMLLGLQVALERHRGVARQVAWPRLKVDEARAAAFAKLLRPGALFVGDVRDALQPGNAYAFATATGETYSGRVEFVRENRGFCLSVRELNDALLWLTIEGASGSVEMQIWISTFGLELARVGELERTWKERLQAIFAS